MDEYSFVLLLCFLSYHQTKERDVVDVVCIAGDSTVTKHREEGN